MAFAQYYFEPQKAHHYPLETTVMRLAYSLTQAETQKNVQAVLHDLWPVAPLLYHKSLAQQDRLRRKGF
ncbi:MAG: hypothetical protein ACXVPD_16020 [Bacteroidia bacterium]